jgi:hypothetical protein
VAVLAELALTFVAKVIIVRVTISLGFSTLGCALSPADEAATEANPANKIANPKSAAKDRDTVLLAITSILPTQLVFVYFSSYL